LKNRVRRGKGCPGKKTGDRATAVLPAAAEVAGPAVLMKDDEIKNRWLLQNSQRFYLTPLFRNN
jgi:hypothetical protein